jgi:hypothetical protein
LLERFRTITIGQGFLFFGPILGEKGNVLWNGAPGRIGTCGPQIRRAKKEIFVKRCLNAMNNNNKSRFSSYLHDYKK